MNTILSGVNTVDGVMGSFIFNQKGEVFAVAMPEFYSSILPQVTETLLQSFAPQQAEEQGWELSDFFVQFEGGTLFLRYANGLYIAALCESHVKSSFLNIAMNVAKMKLGQSPGISILPSVSQSMVPLMSQSAAVPLMSQSAAPPMHHNISQSVQLGSSRSLHVSNSGGWSISGGSNIAPENIPPDAIGARAVKDLTRALARFIGPVAKPVMKKALIQLGAHPQTIAASQCSTLLSILETELNVDERADFYGKASAILKMSL